MEYRQIVGDIEDRCVACLGSEAFVKNLTENNEIRGLFMDTFNLEVRIDEGCPKYLCAICQKKLDEAAEFLAQVKNSLQYFDYIKRCQVDVEEGDIKQEDKKDLVPYYSEEAETGFDENRDENFQNCSNSESSPDSDSDNEPLIKFVSKNKRKKNRFNSKLKRIPLEEIEKAIEEYRQKCKENSNCVLCDFKGLNIRNLSCHMIFKHKEEKHNWCLRCNMMVEDIESHKTTHTNKIFCNFCGKDINRCHYLEHLKSHAGLDFPCGECPKRFISQKSLDEHMARHKHQKPFKCHVCNKHFKLLKSLEDHVLTHGRYKCEVCKKNFEIPELLASHLCSGKTDKNEQSDVEQNVDKTEDNDHYLSYSLDQNFDKEVDDKGSKDVSKNNMESCDTNSESSFIKLIPDIQVESLTCHFCQRTYKTAYKLQKHIEAHMGIFLAKCKYCDKGFSSKADLSNHERVHTKEKPFICSSCGKGFVSSATLRIHMKQHTGKPEECELCHKRFCRKSELKLHLQKHRGERPFLCTDCGKSFAQKSHLTCHLTMHSEERPFPCSICEKTFKKKELLKHHMKLHGEKKFKCTVCFYECHKRYRLQQHLKSHEGKTGVKMISCQLCTRSFNSVQLLNIHMGNIHNVII